MKKTDEPIPRFARQPDGRPIRTDHPRDCKCADCLPTPLSRFASEDGYGPGFYRDRFGRIYMNE